MHILLIWSSVMELANLRTISDSVRFKDQLKTFPYKISFAIRWKLLLISALFLHLFGSKLGFSRMLDSLYGAFWRRSRVWL